MSPVGVYKSRPAEERGPAREDGTVAVEAAAKPPARVEVASGAEVVAAAVGGAEEGAVEAAGGADVEGSDGCVEVTGGVIVGERRKSQGSTQFPGRSLAVLCRYAMTGFSDSFYLGSPLVSRNITTK